MLQDILIERKVYASEEHKMMKGMIQEFISNEIMDHIDEWEKNGMVSREIWKRAGELGLLCIDMPEIYGGGGLDFTFNAINRRICKKRISGPGFSLHSDIVAPYLLKYGTEDQKQKYQMAKGEMIHRDDRAELWK
jgi:acyl-CoA dehydrogenase